MLLSSIKTGSNLVLLVTIWYFFSCETSNAQLSYDRAALRELAQFPQQHRFSEGRLCAALFAQDDHVYTNCTTATSPDGQTGREWCFLADQLRDKNQKNWGYCSPPVDYNFVRAKANEAFITKMNEVSKILMRLDSERARLEDVSKRYNATCGHRRETVAVRLEKIQQLLSKADRSLVQIQETTTKITSLQNTISRLNDEIGQLTSEPPTAENCAGVQGYEDENVPDGLRAEYYPNVYFKGPPIYRVDDQIEFEWNSRDPLPGIPYEGFSIRWTGSLEAPYTGEYVFSVVADCGARVLINNKPVIVDRMPFPKLIEERIPSEIPLEPPSEHDGERKVSSTPMTMNAGEKNLLRVEMLHSSHLKWANPDDASIKLMWSSAHIPEQVIPKTAFYQMNIKPPLKISGLNPENFELTFLYDGEYAYKDSTSHYLADIPLLYYGLKIIRGFRYPTSSSITFETNIPATLFLGTPRDSGSPVLTPCEGLFLQINDIISVYEAPSRNSRATSVEHFSLYKLELAAPGVFKFDIIRAGVPFIMFFRPTKAFQGACGGKLMVVSNPENTKTFLSCEASSMSGPSYACQYGLSGIQTDQPFGMWRSSGGNGVGEYIIIRFKTKVRLTQLRFIPRSDPVTWPAELTLSFAESVADTTGKTKTFIVSHAGNMDALRYPLDSIITNFVRVEVSRMYVNGEDTGGSFEFMGTECVDDSRQEDNNNPSLTNDVNQYPVQPQIPQSTHITLIEKCSDTLKDISNVHRIELGSHFHFACPVSCVRDLREAPASFSVVDAHVRHVNGSIINLLKSVTSQGYHVYGDDTYAPESSLCAAALHMGICTASSQTSSDYVCNVTAHLVEKKGSFTGVLRNDIQSEPHGPSEFGVVFSRYQSTPTQDTTASLEVNYGIVFRSVDMAAPPPGYFVDDGRTLNSADHSVNIKYGWERPAQVVHCERQGTEHENPLNTGGIEFPPDKKSILCDSSMADCTPNFWTIYLPKNGVYRVQVQVGNPCHPAADTRRYYLQGNDVSIVEGEDLSRAQYFWATVDVPVTNLTLTLKADCAADEDHEEEVCNTAVTTIMNVKISDSPVGKRG